MARFGNHSSVSGTAAEVVNSHQQLSPLIRKTHSGRDSNGLNRVKKCRRENGSRHESNSQDNVV